MASEAPPPIEQQSVPAPDVADTQMKTDEPAAEEDPVAPAPDRVPTRKDVSLRELLHRIDDYAPIVNLAPSF